MQGPNTEAHEFVIVNQQQFARGLWARRVALQAAGKRARDGSGLTKAVHRVHLLPRKECLQARGWTAKDDDKR
jgi:hypothetical protein